ncbi:GH12 family glycosyl hydrolase domain-containing protein [Actinomycetospora termitidis]|uniref:Glycosyl hydrolase family 12 n=1 Tax=Actinomycetospora termitidis TaxID=3053470 RepID=A0ABT7MAR3_9PSEU|nr:hypothetical protein [Actinomycetospora sp. Odt1-22]MDL5156932.1 hypothetical protein [Actinomycetospora sp. Odt1-22]
MNGRWAAANETPEDSRRRVGRHRRPGVGRRAPAGTVPRHGRGANRRTDAVRAVGGGLALVALAVVTGLPHGAATADPRPATVAVTTTSTLEPAAPSESIASPEPVAPTGTTEPSAPEETTTPETTTPETTTPETSSPETVATDTPATTAGAPQRAEEKKVCEKFGSTPVAGGRYEVQNSLWGASTSQCIVAYDGPSAGPTGASAAFRVEAKHRNDSGPASYPSIVYGCNYGNCTKGTPFPRPIADLGDLRSSWSVKTPTSGDYNVAYDIWLDPTARKEGRPTGLELMIWLKHTDRVQPIGDKVGTTTLDGVGYDVWLGKADLPTISYVRQQQTTEVKDLNISTFVADAQKRGQAKQGWYLTSVQAGFEPWIGGDGLETTSYSVTRNGQ